MNVPLMSHEFVERFVFSPGCESTYSHKYLLNPRLECVRFGDDYNLAIPRSESNPFIVCLNQEQMFIVALAILGYDNAMIYCFLNLQRKMDFVTFEKGFVILVDRLIQYGIIAERNIPHREPRRYVKPTIASEFHRSPLFFKIPLVNPNQFLSRIEPYFGWMFFKEVIIFFSLLSFLPIATFFFNEAKMAEEAAWYKEFFSLTSAISITIFMLILKIPHEIAHGLAVKWNNRNVWEMGTGFLIGTPCLFADVSETYLEKNKWNRILVALAGVYVDLLITGIAAALFSMAPPGDISTISRMVVYANLGYTMFVNLIPFTRFDGHYALAYFWERQNLANDANQYMLELLRLGLLKESTSGKEDDKADRHLLLLFGVISFIYKVLLFCGVVRYLSILGEPYGLGFVFGLGGVLLMLGVRKASFSATDKVNTVSSSNPKESTIPLAA